MKEKKKEVKKRKKKTKKKKKKKKKTWPAYPILVQSITAIQHIIVFGLNWQNHATNIYLGLMQKLC